VDQDWRSFLRKVEQTRPAEVLRIRDEISPVYEVTALMEELARQGATPLVILENVKGHSMPVVTNLSATRARMALAFGVEEASLNAEYARRAKTTYPVEVVKNSATRFQVTTGSEVDVGRLPILTHYQDDPAPYVTAGLIVSADRETGGTSLGYHRLMVTGRNRFGISLHSRKRLWEYHKKAEERGENLPAACVIGVHPLISLASIGVFPREVGKGEVAGGLLGEPLQVVEAINSPLMIPAYAEIVLEGEILAGVREPEGPFGEITGYSSFRSTQNVFVVHTMYHRQNPLYHSIVAGLSAEHALILAVPREADLFRALSSAVPGLQAVHVPLSGCGCFHAYVSIKKSAAGQGKQAILAALGVDHVLKLVVVVDDDIDVYNEFEVLWAISTRFQADRDLVVVPGAMGVILDPSASPEGVSARMGIDATRSPEFSAKRYRVPEEAKRAAMERIVALRRQQAL
jgi:2,5-furandicarboxylate decarboxylase 1